MTSNSLELFMWTAWGEFQWYEKDYSWCQLLLWFLIGGYFGEYVGTWLLFSQFSMDHQMFWFCQEKSLFMVLRPIYKESLTFLRKIATQSKVKKQFTLLTIAFCNFLNSDGKKQAKKSFFAFFPLDLVDVHFSSYISSKMLFFVSVRNPLCLIESSCKSKKVDMHLRLSSKWILFL